MLPREPIRTERLLLEPIGPEHATAIWEATEPSLEELRRWLPWAQQASETTSRDFAEGAPDHWHAGTDYAFALMRRGSLIGSVGLHVSRLVGLGELGYWVRSELRGQGFVPEAVGALVALGFEAVGLDRLELRAGVENRPSQRVAEKLGFTREGMLRRGCPLGPGKAYDCYIYGLLAEDWRAGA